MPNPVKRYGYEWVIEYRHARQGWLPCTVLGPLTRRIKIVEKAIREGRMHARPDLWGETSYLELNGYWGPIDNFRIANMKTKETIPCESLEALFT